MCYQFKPNVAIQVCDTRQGPKKHFAFLLSNPVDLEQGL